MSDTRPPRPATIVRAPVAGRTVDVTQVPDPVFAEGLVGPGLAIEPDDDAGTVAVAPVTGTIVKLHPHAFVIAADDGPAILVHLGIDTVELRGTGFRLHVTQGDRVEAGRPVIGWDPAAVRAGGRSPVVPVVALDTPSAHLVDLAVVGSTLTTTDPLFTIVTAPRPPAVEPPPLGSPTAPG